MVVQPLLRAGVGDAPADREGWGVELDVRGRLLRTAGALLALALLAGCARPIWTKPGVTQQEYHADSYACDRDMRESGLLGGVGRASRFLQPVHEGTGIPPGHRGRNQKSDVPPF
jgi:hypothetical protein